MKHQSLSMEEQYLDLLEEILETGFQKGDRTGTGTLSLFGHQMRCHLKYGLPLLTTKKVNFNAVLHELLWFLSGDTNIKYLKDNGVGIWDQWADENGDLGPVYGHQWRSFGARNIDLPMVGTIELGGIDQITNVIDEIKANPNSRRLIVTGWNPAEVNAVKLPPCHTLFQFYVIDGKLSCQLYQRSADVFLGVPFNIASYALLTHMVAHVCDLEVGDFVHTFGDVHIYNNHIEQVKTQLSRDPRQMPKLIIKRKVESIFDFKFEDFEIEGYNPHAFIKGEVSV